MYTVIRLLKLKKLKSLNLVSL